MEAWILAAAATLAGLLRFWLSLRFIRYIWDSGGKNRDDLLAAGRVLHPIPSILTTRVNEQRAVARHRATSQSQETQPQETELPRLRRSQGGLFRRVVWIL